VLAVFCVPCAIHLAHRAPRAVDAGVVVSVLRERDAARNAVAIDVDGDVLPVAVVIEEQRTFVVRVEEPVLDVDASVGPRVDVHIRDPIPRVRAARPDVGREAPSIGSQVGNAANPGEQPPDRRRPVPLLRIENHGRREAGGQGGFQGVRQPILIRVIDAQRPRAPDRRGRGAAEGVVPPVDTVDQREEEEGKNDQPHGPGDAVTQWLLQGAAVYPIRR
jgi:hypothetical protein